MNTETDTPRTDAKSCQLKPLDTLKALAEMTIHAGDLEQELNEARQRIAKLERRPMTAEEICDQ